jgi:hypothetical protein
MKYVLFTLVVLATVASCKKDEDERYYKGGEVEVYHGKAWTWIRLDEQGAPEQLAVSINDAALASVDEGTVAGHSHENDLVISLPKEAGTATPFKFILLNWEAHGHEPSELYGVPHFDVHYYLVTPEEVMATTDTVKMAKHPASGYLPLNYVAGPGVPRMGVHWLDVTSPEVSGQPFTQTFIFGSNDGAVTFYEPMITLNFFRNTNKFERTIPTPAKFEKEGYFPTKMRVVKENGATNVILEGFVKRQAS